MCVSKGDRCEGKKDGGRERLDKTVMEVDKKRQGQKKIK